MEPLSPQDPLYHLLGKTKPVEPRADFTRNVLRVVRQLPQSESAWERFLHLLTIPRATTSFAFAAALALGVFVLWNPSQSNRTTLPVADAAIAQPVFDFTKPSESDVASELDGMNHLSALLAQQDTSALTDSDIAFLLY